VTHQPEEQPPEDEFIFVGSVVEAVGRAKAVAGDKQAHIMGGGQIIRQALSLGLVDTISVIVAPVILGGGKRLFDGFSKLIELEHLGVRQSAFATFIDYRVKK
jgi:dihydrofolate reductase